MHKRHLLMIIALTIVSAVGLATSGDEPPPPKQQAAKQSSRPQPLPPQEQPQPPPPRKTVSWPPPPDNGSEPPVAENLLAKNYYVILDSSGSMGDSKCSGNMSKSQAAKIALAHFAQAVPDDANLGLGVFDANGIAERVPLGQDNRGLFITQVNTTVPGNGTPLHNAVVLAYQKIEEMGRRQLGYGEYHLVIVTDGEANEGQDPTRAVNYILAHTPIVIHTIGFCIGTDHSLNQPGRTIYKAADNPEALSEGLREVLAEAPGFDVAEF